MCVDLGFRVRGFWVQGFRGVRVQVCGLRLSKFRVQGLFGRSHVVSFCGLQGFWLIF